jgi:7,8-dihydroneopterin aldolase/epimerase/oxygenase
MDKITLKNMKFYAYHGVLEEEQQNGQHFYIDVEMFCDVREAGVKDDLEKTVNYAAVYDIIKNTTINNKFRLIECLADRISREIMSSYVEIQEIIVRVRKPEAPINGELDWAEVEIKRNRNDF